MEISIFLAKVFGLYIGILSLLMIFFPARFQVMIDDMLNCPAVLSLSAVITLILGILLIVSHNIWVADWRGVVTVLAWLVFIKGVIRVFAPQSGVNMVKSIESSSYYIAIGVIYFVIAAYLLYKGFSL